MSKARRKKRSGLGSPDSLVIIGVGAVIVALTLIVLGGGFAPPTTPPSGTTGAASAQGLVLCNGKPCPMRGQADAPVTLIEVSDYACSACRAFNLSTAAILVDRYVKTGKVRHVSHVFALWPESQASAAASLCANEQDKYWEFHRQAFVNQKQEGFPAAADFLDWGQQIGLDSASFAECVNSGRYAQDAQMSAFEGQRAGVSSTPTFFINGRMIRGNAPLDQFERAIEAALAGQ